MKPQGFQAFSQDGMNEFLNPSINLVLDAHPYEIGQVVNADVEVFERLQHPLLFFESVISVSARLAISAWARAFGIVAAKAKDGIVCGHCVLISSGYF